MRRRPPTKQGQGAAQENGPVSFTISTPTPNPMNYAEMTANQEQPEIMPNVLAHHLSELTGYHHYTAHRALLATNFELVLTDGGPVLTLDDLAAVLSVVGSELLRDLV